MSPARALAALLFAAALAVAAGCGGDDQTRTRTRMRKAETIPDKPPMGKVLVFFHRPSIFAAGIRPTIRANDRAIGVSKGGIGFYAVLEPGPQYIFCKSGDWRVVKADLTADQVYDIYCSGSLGWVNRVHLTPITRGSEHHGKHQALMAEEGMEAIDQAAPDTALSTEEKAEIVKLLDDLAKGTKRGDVELRELKPTDHR